MTAIVGVANGENVWLGGDSAWSTFYTVDVSEWSKVWIANAGVSKIAVGIAGSGRPGQLIRYNAKWPALPAKKHGAEGLDKYMATRFADEVRRVLRAGGVLRKTNEVEGHDARLIVGVRGRLYVSSGNFQFESSSMPYKAIGSGMEVALGALDVLDDQDGMAPEDLIRRALEAAERHTPFVRGPFRVVKV